MTKIDEKLILNLENLAKLMITEKEKEKIKSDLNAIVEMFDKLKEVDTDGIEPLIHLPSSVNISRRDKIEGELTDIQAMANVPLKKGKFIAVPKFLKPKK